MPGPSERPRILRIITRLNIGGPAIQAARLTTELRPLGYDTWLVHGRVAAREGTLLDLLPADDPGVHFIERLQRPIAPLADVAAFRAIYSILKTVQPHIVHTHMAKAGLLGRAAAVLYNRRFSRHPARIVHTYHGHVLDGYFRPWLSAVFIRLERLLARYTDALIAISPRVRDELVEQFRIAPPTRFHVVPLGFDLAALSAIDDDARALARPALDIPPGSVVITTVGRLTAIKNHALFLEAAALVARQTPHALFLIVGDGELRAELEQLAASAGLAGRVRFLGWRRDLATIYAATDVFVLTSRNEGTPVALIEAMAAGVPGVATTVGGVLDVLTDEGVGYTVPSDDAAMLAEAINKLSASPEIRKNIGLRARAAVVSRYSQERLVTDVASLYHHLLGLDKVGGPGG